MSYSRFNVQVQLVLSLLDSIKGMVFPSGEENCYLWQYTYLFHLQDKLLYGSSLRFPLWKQVKCVNSKSMFSMKIAFQIMHVKDLKSDGNNVWFIPYYENSSLVKEPINSPTMAQPMILNIFFFLFIFLSCALPSELDCTWCLEAWSIASEAQSQHTFMSVIPVMAYHCMLYICKSYVPTTPLFFFLLVQSLFCACFASTQLIMRI